MKMRIGIDARFFGPKCKGLGRYTQKLLEHLSRTDRENEYYVFLSKDGFGKFNPNADNFKKILADYHWYGWKEQIFFPKLLSKYKLDLVHFCHFNVPFFYRKKFIVTIHDLILFHYPTTKNTTLNKLYYFFKLAMYHLIIRSAARRSEKIIAVSDFTKKDIENKLKINPEKIRVVYEGYETKSTAESGGKKGSAIFSKYGIMKPYIIYAGNAYPHKNLERLCLAFRLLKKEFRGLRLVLVGETDYFYDRIKKFILSEKIKDVVLTGFVEDEELDVLYENSQCFVFPSLYEGFGLPPLEALSKETAVAVSQKTSLPEVLKDAAEYFNPEDEISIAGAVKKLLIDKGRREEIVEKGKSRLRIFSWKKMAEEMRSEYEKLQSKQAEK